MSKGPHLKNQIADAENTLNRILYMISKDVFACEKFQNNKEVKWKTLDPETAGKLINYARALKSIIEIHGSQRKKARKMTDQELQAALSEALEAEKLKDPDLSDT